MCDPTVYSKQLLTLPTFSWAVEDLLHLPALAAFLEENHSQLLLQTHCFCTWLENTKLSINCFFKIIFPLSAAWKCSFTLAGGGFLTPSCTAKVLPPKFANLGGFGRTCSAVSPSGACCRHESEVHSKGAVAGGSYILIAVGTGGHTVNRAGNSKTFWSQASTPQG